MATKQRAQSDRRQLAAEVNAHGVRVLSVYLGRTASEMQERIHRTRASPTGRNCYYSLKMWTSLIIGGCALGLPRTAEVTDIHIRLDEQDLKGDPDRRPRRLTE